MYWKDHRHTHTNNPSKYRKYKFTDYVGNMMDIKENKTIKTQTEFKPDDVFFSQRSK